MFFANFGNVHWLNKEAELFELKQNRKQNINELDKNDFCQSQITFYQNNETNYPTLLNELFQMNSMIDVNGSNNLRIVGNQIIK